MPTPKHSSTTSRIPNQLESPSDSRPQSPNDRFPALCSGEFSSPSCFSSSIFNPPEFLRPNTLTLTVTLRPLRLCVSLCLSLRGRRRTRIHLHSRRTKTRWRSRTHPGHLHRRRSSRRRPPQCHPGRDHHGYPRRSKRLDERHHPAHLELSSTGCCLCFP